MKKRVIASKFSAVILLGLLIVVVPARADERDEPIDIIVALDKSLSMEEEIEAVKEYVNTRIVDDLLQNGDFFLVLSFFGKAPVAISDFIKGQEHKEQIKQRINGLNADGDWTDIGNALDKLKEEVQKRSGRKRRKTLLLITDGKHEPPPGSKYFSKDGTVSHEYLEVTSETQKEGWKIIVLGLGTESARELAKDLAADYIETPKGATASQIKDAVPDLAGTMKVKGDAELSPVNYNGRSDLTITIESSLYREPVEVVIEGIRIDASGLTQENLLLKPFLTQIPQEGETRLHIPLYFNETFVPGTYEGTLTLRFASKEHFETELRARFRVNTLFQNFYWLIPIILALVVLVFLIAFRLAGGKRIAFRLLVEEHPLPKTKDSFTARQGKDLFIKEAMDIVDITPNKTAKSIAKLNATDAGLTMAILKDDRFPELKSGPKNVMDKSYILRTESGKDYHIRFTEIG
jgi:Mg-chelatase subunit ChlD